jgi:excisionase family DNA binding protein
MRSNSTLDGSSRLAAQNNDMDHLWTACDVCELLGISRRTLDKLIHRGMPRIRIGRILRFHGPSVRNWIHSQN